eukprot:8804593-Alexandrium_andersonii.AAC.1
MLAEHEGDQRCSIGVALAPPSAGPSTVTSGCNGMLVDCRIVIQQWNAVGDHEASTEQKGLAV